MAQASIHYAAKDLLRQTMLLMEEIQSLLEIIKMHEDSKPSRQQILHLKLNVLNIQERRKQLALLLAPRPGLTITSARANVLRQLDHLLVVDISL